MQALVCGISYTPLDTIQSVWTEECGSVWAVMGHMDLLSIKAACNINILSSIGSLASVLFCKQIWFPIPSTQTHTHRKEADEAGRRGYIIELINKKRKQWRAHKRSQETEYFFHY